jgi:hypothetical protein
MPNRERYSHIPPIEYGVSQARSKTYHHPTSVIHHPTSILPQAMAEKKKTVSQKLVEWKTLKVSLIQSNGGFAI